MKRAIVVGSGFGGLSTAIRLQAQGYQTTILEKNNQVGGHASQLKIDGYTFDMGPSLITAPKIIDSIFEAAGKKRSDYIDFMPIDPFYRINYHDGSYLDYSPHVRHMQAQLSEFHPEDGRNYPEFLEYAQQIYKSVLEDGLGSQPFTTGTMLKFLPQATRLQAFRSAYSVAAKFFKDPRSRFAFSFHPLFIGGSPFNSPAIYLMIPYLEKDQGVWYTKGGMYSLVQALEKLFRDIGGAVLTDSPAERFEIDNGRVRGVTSNDVFYSADVVVSNAHFAHTHLDLIPPPHRKRWSAQRVKNRAYGMSTFLLYLGVNRQYPNLRHHTLILSKRYRELVKDIFDRKVLADDFSLYLHVPSRTDVSMAPAGKESMYVLAPVPNLQADVDWSVEAPRYRDKILNHLEHEFGMEGLQTNLEVCEMFTPRDFESQRNNYLGAAWGLEPRLTQSASFRPGNRSDDVKGLYLVGASTHPGAGVPGVMLSAEATEQAIIEDQGIIKSARERQSA